MNMYRIGFDNEKYLKLQSEHINERIEQFGGKLYLEFGGKLFDDYHASRVLPGFQPDSKLQLLLKLKDIAEIIVVINSDDFVQHKVREDIGITYDQDVYRLIDAFVASGLYVSSVCLTRFHNQNGTKPFERKLNKQGIRTYHTLDIPDYPYNLDHVLSDDGLGKNDWIPTTRKLVVVTAPGPGSGKMATCISQIYNDSKRGISSGYAKFETFPIWNLPLKHPVNLAYEAATADLNDVNMIDPYHLEAYGVTTVNYNRDIDTFPVLNRLFEKLYGHSPYKSPTDMGVNMAGFCISDDDVCQEAAKQEIIRRYYRALVDQRNEKATQAEVDKIAALMTTNNIELSERKCVEAAREKARQTHNPACAMETNEGEIITGKTSSLLSAVSALILNALKSFAGIKDDVTLLPKNVIEPVSELKTRDLGGHNPRLHLDETLVALSISAVLNPLAELAVRQLGKLRHTQVHSTVILSSQDESTLKKLGIDLTCDPVYATKKLYHSNH